MGVGIHPIMYSNPVAKPPPAPAPKATTDVPPGTTRIEGGGVGAVSGPYEGYQQQRAGTGQSGPSLPSLPGLGTGTGTGGTGIGGTPGTGGNLPIAGDGSSLVNKAQNDPLLMENVANLRARMSADPTQRAIERATTGALDAASLGAADAGAANMASRGLVGTGAGQAFLNKQFFAPAQRAAAQSAADISLQRERDLDALVLGGAGIMSAPGQMGLAEKELGLRQYQTQTGLTVEEQKLALEAQRIQMEEWLKMYGLSREGGAIPQAA